MVNNSIGIGDFVVQHDKYCVASLKKSKYFIFDQEKLAKHTSGDGECRREDGGLTSPIGL